MANYTYSYDEYMDLGDYDDNLIQRLYKPEGKWYGTKIEELSNSNLRNTINYLLKHSLTLQNNYIGFLLDYEDDMTLKPKDDIETINNMNSDDWLITTPLFRLFIYEWLKRDLPTSVLPKYKWEHYLSYITDDGKE